MEGRVETGDNRDAARGVSQRVDGRQGLCLMEGCEIAERLDACPDPGAHEDRPGELGATLDDAVAHSLDPSGRPDPAGEVAGSHPSGEAPGRQQRIPGVEDGEFQAAGTCVDDQDP